MMELRTEEIITMIRRKKRTSRIQLAKLTGLSKPTISSIVNTLIGEGLVVETGPGTGKITGGRKPINLSFVADYKYVLSVDIGGTKTVVALVDLDGNISQSDVFPSKSLHTGRGIIEELHSKLEERIGRIGRDRILGISIGVPGTVDGETQIVTYIPSFNIGDLDLKSPLEEAFGLPVIVENDVTLAAFGESWIGAASRFDNVLLVSIGTGIGAGLVVGNTVYKGYTGGAGEVGEMITDWSTESKKTSDFGRLEEWLSGHSLESFCIENNFEPDIPNLFERFEHDAVVKKRIVDGCVHLALAFANSILLLDPARLIIGGGIGFNQYDRIFPIIEETLKSVLPEAAYRSDLLDKSSLEPYSVVIGGACLAQKRLLLGEICGRIH